MNGLTLQGLSAIPRPAVPAPFFWIPSTGQSLATGYGTQTTRSTTQPFSNKMLIDSLGIASGYVITNPNAPTLSLQPLTCPAHGAQGTMGNLAAYPENAFGENLDVALANQLSYLSQKFNYQAIWQIGPSMLAQGGQPMTVIQKNGTGNAYAASLYELNAYKRLLGFSPLCPGVILTHGENDAIPPTNTLAGYLAQLQALQSNYQTDISAITGQTTTIPLYMTQQHSQPFSLAGLPFTSAAMFQAFLSNPSLFVLVGTKYQLFPTPDSLHQTEDGYRVLGEKIAQAIFWPRIYGQPWKPLYPTAVSRSGTTVTISLYVPVAPLVFDVTRGQPHQSGQFAMWSGGQGFEFWDQTLTVTNATNASPIVLTVSGGTPPASGTIAVEGVLGNTGANGVWSFTASGQNITLTGSSGNGSYTPSSGNVFFPIGITNATISWSYATGWQIALTIARPPVAGTGILGYAQHADTAYNGACSGNYPAGRCGCVRDSDEYYRVARSWLFPNPTQLSASMYRNWLVDFGLMSVA